MRELDKALIPICIPWQADKYSARLMWPAFASLIALPYKAGAHLLIRAWEHLDRGTVELMQEMVAEGLALAKECIIAALAGCSSDTELPYD